MKRFPQVVSSSTKSVFVSIFAGIFLLTLTLFVFPKAYGVLGEEFQVNSYTTNDQKNPSVATLSNGNFVVVWDSNGQDGNSAGIYAQIFDSSGVKISSEFLVNTHTAGAQDLSFVASLDGGDFVVAWRSHNQDGYSWGVYAQIFDASGNKVGNEFLVNTYKVDQQYDPAIAKLNNGNFVIAWHSGLQDGDGWGVYAKIFNALGSKVVDEFLVNDHTTDHQSIPSIAVLNNGKFVITWQSGNQDGDSYGVYCQIFNESGDKSGTEFRANSYATSTQAAPQVTALSNSNFVVTWHSYHQDGSVFGIYAQIFNESGAEIGSEFLVNTSTSGNQQNPRIISFSNGNFVVVWEDGEQDGSGYGVYAQVFDVNGTKVGDEFRVNTNVAGNQQNPAAASLNNGNFVVVWESENQDGDGYGIFGKILPPNPSSLPVVTSSVDTISLCDSDPVTIDSSIDVFDIDNTKLQKATVSMSGDFNPQFDSLEFTNQNGVIGCYNSTTGRLDFTGYANLTDYRSALRSVQYKRYGSFFPSKLITTSFVINDGILDSNPAEVNITTTGCPTNHPPLVYDFTKKGFVNGTTMFNKWDFINSFNDIDSSDSLKQIQIKSLPSNGKIKLRGEDVMMDQKVIAEDLNDITFVPDPSWVGVTAFDWQGFDFRSQSQNTATVNVENRISTQLSKEFQVNTWTADDQRNPAVALLNNGNFIVVWTSIGQDGSSGGIYGQIFNSLGVKVGSEFLVNTYTPSDQTLPAVTTLNSGNFVVTWYGGANQDGSDHGVFYQIFNSSGTQVGIERQANTYTDGNQINPSVAALNNGGFVIAWNSDGQDGDGSGAYFQIFDAVGDKVGDELLVNDYTTSNQDWPYIASLNNGNFVIAWRSYGQDGSKWGIYAKIFDASGVKIVDEFQVNTFINNSQGARSISTLRNGDFVIVWSSSGQDGSGFGVYAQIFNESGVEVGNEIQINTYITGTQQNPSVAPLNNGGFIVAWESEEQDGSGYGIYAQVFDANGNKVWDEFQVNTHINSNQQDVRITKLNNGDLVVVWESHNQDGDEDGVFGKIFTIKPQISSTKTSTSVCNCAPTIIDNSIELSNLDNDQIQNATVTMLGDFNPYLDLLEFTDQNGITGYYNDTTGRLELTGNANLESYQSALRNIEYKRLGSFLPADKKIVTSFEVNNGDFASGKLNIDINALGCPVNNPPTINDVSKDGVVDTDLSFSADDFINRFSDSDPGNMLQQIQIVNLPVNGTLTLAGKNVTADQEIITEDINSLSFAPNPSWFGITNFNWKGFDCRSSSNEAAVNLNIRTDVPLISAISGKLVCDCDSTNIVDGALTLTDINSVSLQGATVKMLGNVDLNYDSLGFINQNDIYGNYSDATGTLTLSGDSNIANYQTALRTIVYKHIGPFLAPKAIDISFTANDGANDGNTAYVKLHSDGCSIGNTPTTGDVYKVGVKNTDLTFSSEDFSDQFSDLDAGDSLRQIKIVNLPGSEHGRLEFAGKAVTIGQEILVEDIGDLVFVPKLDWISDDVVASFNWKGFDCQSASDASLVKIEIKTDKPLISVLDSVDACNCNVANIINKDLNITDANSDFLQSASVKISGDVDFALDSLEFNKEFCDQNNINGGYDGNGKLFFEGESSLANYQRALRSVAYRYSGILSDDDVITASFSVSDDVVASDTVDTSIIFDQCAIGNLPTVNDFSKKGITNGIIAFSSSDFSGHFSDADIDDSLRQVEIVSVPIHGKLKLGAVEVLSNQKIIAEKLDDLYFVADDDWNGETSFRWKGFDCRMGSNEATVSIKISEDKPLISTSYEKVICDCDLTSVLDGNLTVSHDHKDFLHGAKIVLSGNDLNLNVDSLEFPSDQHYDIKGFYDDDTGELNLVGESSLTNYQSALRNVLYKHIGAFDPADTILASISVNDGEYDSNVATININALGCDIGNKPVISDVSKEENIDTAVLFTKDDFASKFSDLDTGDTLVQIEVVSLPEYGTLKLAGFGDVIEGQKILAEDLDDLIFTPNDKWKGKTSFKWKGFDCQSASDEADVDIEITESMLEKTFWAALPDIVSGTIGTIIGCVGTVTSTVVGGLMLCYFKKHCAKCKCCGKSGSDKKSDEIKDKGEVEEKELKDQV